MDLSIVIINWNTRDMLRDCLQTVFAGLGDLNAEVIVVDNASTDGSGLMVATEFPQIRLISNVANRGFAAANNQGFAAAKGRHVLLLNSDTLVLGAVLPAMVDFMDAHPAVGIMGPRVLNRDGTMQVSATGFPTLGRLVAQTLGLNRFKAFDGYRMAQWDRRSQREVEVISGCCMLVRGSALQKVGPLDADFFFYGEETDWCRRFADAGWQVVFAPVGEIVHFGGGSVRSLNHKRDVMLTEGTVRLHRKHGGLLAGLACYALLFGFNLSRAALWGLLSVKGGAAARERAKHFARVAADYAKAWPETKTKAKV